MCVFIFVIFTRVHADSRSADAVCRLRLSLYAGHAGLSVEGHNSSFSSKLHIWTQPIPFFFCLEAGDSGVKFQTLLFLSCTHVQSIHIPHRHEQNDDFIASHHLSFTYSISNIRWGKEMYLHSTRTVGYPSLCSFSQQ